MNVENHTEQSLNARRKGSTLSQNIHIFIFSYFTGTRCVLVRKEGCLFLVDFSILLFAHVAIVVDLESKRVLTEFQCRNGFQSLLCYLLSKETIETESHKRESARPHTHTHRRATKTLPKPKKKTEPKKEETENNNKQENKFGDGACL